jgi:hypothetical protein
MGCMFASAQQNTKDGRKCNLFPLLFSYYIAKRASPLATNKILGFEGDIGIWGSQRWGKEVGGGVQDATLFPTGVGNNKIKFHRGSDPRILKYVFQFTFWLYTTMQRF